jgi:hypothetical protein
MQNHPPERWSMKVYPVFAIPAFAGFIASAKVQQAD